MGIYASNICTFSCYNVLISSFPCFSFCFSAHASFHTASKFLPQDISSNRIPSVEIMSYRDSTFIPKGHQTYEEIKDSSEKCQREKGDCLTQEFVSSLSESSFLENQSYDLKDLKGIWEKWSPERQAEFKGKYGEIALLLNVEIDWQLIKAIMPFWDPSYRCFTFNQEDITPTIEEYSFMLRIEPRNADKVF